MVCDRYSSSIISFYRETKFLNKDFKIYLICESSKESIRGINIDYVIVLGGIDAVFMDLIHSRLIMKNPENFIITLNDWYKPLIFKEFLDGN